MRRSLLGAALLLPFAVATLQAQTGINLSWDDCGAFGTANRSFACDTNADSSVMVGSFQVDVGGPCFVGTNCVIDLQAATAMLPDWWQFRSPGTCRQTSMRPKGPYQPDVGCVDPAEGCGTPGVASYDVGATNRVRVITSYVVPCLACFETQAGVENYAIKLIIRHDKTTGTGSCDGCSVPVCIVLNTVHVYASNPTPWDHLELSNPLQRNYVTWQGGSPDCPASTPTLNRTWGALKSAYR